jgi:hypothetical protein
VLVVVPFLWGLGIPGPHGNVVYRDTRNDARDAIGDPMDISSTTRTVYEKENGHRWLRIKIRAYEPLGSPFNFDLVAFIDSHGDRRWNARINFVGFQGPPYCGLLFRGGSGWTAQRN